MPLPSQKPKKNPPARTAVRDPVGPVELADEANISLELAEWQLEEIQQQFHLPTEVIIPFVQQPFEQNFPQVHLARPDPQKDKNLLAAHKDAAASLGLKNPPQPLVSENANFKGGYVESIHKIIVSAEWNELSYEELFAAFAHEFQHSVQKPNTQVIAEKKRRLADPITYPPPEPPKRTGPGFVRGPTLPPEWEIEMRKSFEDNADDVAIAHAGSDAMADFLEHSERIMVLQENYGRILGKTYSIEDVVKNRLPPEAIREVERIQKMDIWELDYHAENRVQDIRSRHVAAPKKATPEREK